MRGVVAVGLVVLASCYQPHPVAGAPCSVDGTCPSGLMCIDNACVVSGGTDDGPRGTDARRDGRNGTDADQALPWSTPTEVPGVNLSTSTEDDPSMSDDGLTIVFISDRGGNPDIYMGTRTSTSQPFTVSALTALNSTGTESSPELSPSGTFLHFVSDRSGTNKTYSSQLSSGSFSTVTLESDLSPQGLGDIAVSPDGLTALYVVESGNNTLWKVTRSSVGGNFGNAVELTALEFSSDIAAPTLTNGGAVIYLHAHNPRDLFAWSGSGMPTAVTELNTPQRDSAPFINQTVTHIVYAHNNDIYEATRP